MLLEMRHRKALDSSAIAAVTYDSEKRTLEVNYRGSDSYRYLHVPEFVYEALLRAESAGAFWNSIKENYRFERLG